MQVTQQGRVTLRLNERVINKLTAQSDELNIPITSLVNRILDNQLFGDNSTPIGYIALCIKIDNLFSTLASMNRKFVQLSDFTSSLRVTGIKSE